MAEHSSVLRLDRTTWERPAPARAPSSVIIDLYGEAQRDEIDKLIARREALLVDDPRNREHYSALRALWIKTKDFDRAFLACRALVYLRSAGRDEEIFYRRHRDEGTAWLPRPLNQTDWDLLRHPDEHEAMNRLFAHCAEPIARANAGTARSLSLRDERRDGHARAIEIYGQVAAGLNLGMPQLFVMPQVEAEIVLANVRSGSCLTPSFVIGRHMLLGRTNAQMVQAMARALSYVRPSAYLRLLFGDIGGLRSVWGAARAVAIPQDGTIAVTLDGEAKEMQRVLGRRAKDGAYLAALRQILRGVREEALFSHFDFERWASGVDATARHTGLLLTGDLEVAAADVAREPLFAHGVSRERRIDGLLLDSVSARHAQLRERLGLALRA